LERVAIAGIEEEACGLFGHWLPGATQLARSVLVVQAVNVEYSPNRNR